MNKITITRYPDQTLQTLGDLIAENDKGERIKLATVELPWKDNRNQVSCIPPGDYPLTKFNSPKHGLCFLIHNVPHRDMCEIHAANYSRELLGCIAPGLSHSDINHDGLLDVVNSRIALDKLLAHLPDHSTLEII